MGSVYLGITLASLPASAGLLGIFFSYRIHTYRVPRGCAGKGRPMAAIAEDDEKHDEKHDEKQADFFRKRLDFVFYDYQKKSRSSRRRYRLIKLSALLFGSTTTALIGIKEFYQTNSAELGVAALICSALATVISQWENIFDYRYWWGEYLKACLSG
jgi:hypothetical protein